MGANKVHFFNPLCNHPFWKFSTIHIKSLRHDPMIKFKKNLEKSIYAICTRRGSVQDGVKEF